MTLHNFTLALRGRLERVIKKKKVDKKENRKCIIS
jgi:hypothetical protein